MSSEYGRNGLSYSVLKNGLCCGILKRCNEMAKQELFWCIDCKKFLPGDKFEYTNEDFNYCRGCIIKRNNRKQRGIKLMGGCCQRCGYKELMSQLDFYPVRGYNEKTQVEYLLDQLGIEIARTELDKCCLLCHICGVEYADNKWEALFIRRSDDLMGYTIEKSWSLDDVGSEEIIPEKKDSQEGLAKGNLNLYLIESKNGLTKIGISKNVKNRLGELKSSSPVSLRLVAYGKSSYSTEGEIHKKFIDKCSHGEWFKLTRKDVNYIINRLNLTRNKDDRFIRAGKYNNVVRLHGDEQRKLILQLPIDDKRYEVKIEEDIRPVILEMIQEEEDLLDEEDGQVMLF